MKKTGEMDKSTGDIQQTTNVCFLCSQKFSGSDEHRKHLSTRIKLEPFVCMDCGATFKSKDESEEHMTKKGHKIRPTEENEKVALFRELASDILYQLNTTNEEELRQSHFLVAKNLKATFIKALNNEELSLEEKESFANEIVKKKHRKFFEKMNDLNTFLSDISPPDNRISDGKLDEIVAVPFDLPSPSIKKNIVNNGNNSNKTKVVTDFMLNIKKMNNDEYLNLRLLGSPSVRKMLGIKNCCNLCRKQINSGKDMILHVLCKHLGVSQNPILQCYVCLKKNGKSRKFIDFDSVRNHYESCVESHGNCKFQNNIIQSTLNDEIFIYVDNNYNPLLFQLYEEMFQKCFIEMGNVAVRSKAGTLNGSPEKRIASPRKMKMKNRIRNRNRIKRRDGFINVFGKKKN